MTNDENLLSDVWDLLKEYIPLKDHSTAADHLVAELIEYGVPDDYIKNLAGCDAYMADIIEENFEKEDDWEDEEYD